MAFRDEILLIRKEYDTAWDTLQYWSQKDAGKGGVVVTGQPGIGKTIFLFYVLLRRLSEGLLTAFHVFSHIFFLFTEAGPSQHDINDIDAPMPRGTWALTNSGELINEPCPAFLAAPRGRVWIIQATLPKRSRWHEWYKQLFARFYVMHWFPPNELEVLGTLLNLNTKELLSYYRTWGPCTRTCIMLVKGTLTVDQHMRSVSVAASKFASDPVSSSADSRSAIRAEVPTKHLNSRMDARQQSLFFTQISSLHPASGCGGLGPRLRDLLLGCQLPCDGRMIPNTYP